MRSCEKHIEKLQTEKIETIEDRIVAAFKEIAEEDDWEYLDNLIYVVNGDDIPCSIVYYADADAELKTVSVMRRGYRRDGCWEKDMVKEIETIRIGMSYAKAKSVKNSLLAIDIPYDDSEWFDAVVEAFDSPHEIVLSDNPVEHPFGPIVYENLWADHMDAFEFQLIIDDDGLIAEVFIN